MFFSLTSPPPCFSPRSYCFRVLTVCSVSSPSCFILSVFRKNSEIINPLLSYSCALLKKECFTNSSTICDFRTLLQNTGGVPPCTEPLSRFLQPPTTNSLVIRTSEKLPCNPFRIRTCKIQHLKSFRIRTYGKTRRGWGCPLLSPNPLSSSLEPLVVS